MKVEFKYPRTIDQKHYTPGHHEVPGSHASHWFFKGLVSSGDVIVIEEEKGSDIPAPIVEMSEPPKTEKPKRGKK